MINTACLMSKYLGILVFILISSLLMISCGEDDGVIFTDESNKYEFSKEWKQIGENYYLLATDSVIKNYSYGQLSPLNIEFEIRDDVGAIVSRRIKTNFEHIQLYRNDSTGYSISWFPECFEGNQELIISDAIFNRDSIEVDSIIFQILVETVKPSHGWFRSCYDFEWGSGDNPRIFSQEEGDIYISIGDSLYHSNEPLLDNWSQKIVRSRFNNRSLEISYSGVLYYQFDVSKLMVSSDNGDTWNNIENPGFNHYFIDKANNVFTVGSTDYQGKGSVGIYKGENLGSSWIQLFDFEEISRWLGRSTDALYAYGDYSYMIQPHYIVKYENESKYVLGDFYYSPWGVNAGLNHKMVAKGDQVYLYEDNNFWHLDIDREVVVKKYSSDNWVKVIENNDAIYLAEANKVNEYQENGFIDFINPTPQHFIDINIQEEFVACLGADGKFYYLFRE